MTPASIADVTLDLTGLLNPEPILRLAEAAHRWDAGQTVRVIADDQCFANDFLRWTAGGDLDVVSLRYLSNGQTDLLLRVPGHKVAGARP